MPKFDGLPYTELTDPEDDDIVGAIKDTSEVNPADQTKFEKHSTLFLYVFNKLRSFIPTAYRIAVSVASNNITVAIKDKDGNDPSVSSPVRVQIGNSVREIISPLSITLNAGTQWFGLGSAFAGLEQNLFVYLAWVSASSEVAIGVSRIPYARLYSSFNSTNTNEKYGAFSTTPASGDDVANIGRFAATLSASPSYNWSVPTFTSANLIQQPVFESDWCSWAPSPQGFSSVPTNTVYIYKFIGKDILIRYRDGANGTSSANTFTATAPFACVTLTNFIAASVGGAIDNNVSIGGTAQISSGGNVITFSPTVHGSGSNTWTPSAGKRMIQVELRYPAAL